MTDAASIWDLTWQAWMTLGTIAVAVGLLVATRLPADFVLMGGVGVLLLTGVLDTQDALTSFASEGLAVVAMLYVAVTGLQETGGLSWISGHVLGRPRGCRRAQLRLMLPVTALSAFLNNTPVVALFIPTVMEWCRRIRIPPSRLLIPLSYGAILGGMCTLVGTSTNLVVNGLVQARYGSDGLGMFEITKIGLPCALIGILYVVMAGRKLLPERKTLEDVFENPREYTLEMQVTPGSPLAGKSIDSSGLRHLPGAFLAELMRGDQVISAVPPDEVLRENDRLVFVGNVDSMRTLHGEHGLRPAPDQLFKLHAPRHERCLVEAVVSDTCPLVRRTIREGRFRNRYNAVVIAVARNGARLRGKIGDIRLRAGDTLLVESHAGFIPRQRDSRDFYLVSAVEDSTPRRTDKAPWAVTFLAAMVIAVAFGWVSMLKAALLASGLMLATRCCSTAQARRSIEWNVLLTIAGALGLGCAMQKTGAASALSAMLLGVAADRPWAALAAIYVLTAVFTELITNNAAAVLVFPVAVAAADRLGVSAMPFIICVMVAASASFATPIGYQTNLMVYGPGGYRFSDYLRIGLPLSLAVGAAAVALAPLIWPFSG